MSTNGHLKFQGTNRATFVGETSNIMFDTTTTSLGIGVTGTDHPSSNLYITGNAYISNSISVGGVLTMGTVNVVARHDLEAVTAMGNTTPLTVEFQNADTSLVTTGNVEVGGELAVSGNATVSSNLIVSGNVEVSADTQVQEYPPRSLHQYSTQVEGHGVFSVVASAELNQTGDNDRAWKLFTKIADADNYWTPASDGYDASTGNATSASPSTDGTAGHWVQLELPYKIKLHSVKIAAGISTRQAKDATVFGSNDGGGTWTSVGGWTDNNVSDFSLVTFSMNNVGYYNLYRLVVTKNGGNAALTLSELQLLGTPGPTTLDKGSFSLTRSLDVPRVSRYDVDTETPRPEKLVLDLDTTVNSLPTDISGQGNHGTFLSNASYSSSDKAFKFDGSGDAIYLAKDTNLPTGDAIYTLSCWLKLDSTQTSVDQSIMYFGSAWAANELAGIRIFGGNKVGGDIGSTQYHTTNAVIVPERWYHIVVVKRGTGVTPAQGASDSYMRIYVDGVQITNITRNGSDRTQGIGIVDRISIGSSFSGNVGSFNESVNGCISNPKIYSVALESSEVQKLYRLGRTGRSMVITDTAVGIGKAPEAQLDVRGTLAVRGNLTAFDRVGVGTASPTTNLDVNGSFKVNGPHSYSGRPVAVVGRAAYPNGRVYSNGIYTFNGVLYNDGNIYNTSNGRFTIPTGWDGYYLLMFTGLGGDQETAPNTRWRVNGTDIAWGAAHANLGSGVNFATANARLGLSTQVVYYLNANDYVQLAVINGSLYGDSTIHSTATVMYLGGN
jgi:hypothetical protein